MDLKAKYQSSLNEVKKLFGRDAHATVSLDGRVLSKNVRLFDWYQLDEDDQVDFYDTFGDIEEENALGDYLVEPAEEFEARLRPEVVPFGYVVDGGAEGDNYQSEGILMLDLRQSPPAVLVASVDGTIDGREPFEVMAGGIAKLKIEPGGIRADED